MTDANHNPTRRRDLLRAGALTGLAAVSLGLLARARRARPAAGCARGLCRACAVLPACRLPAARWARKT